MEGRETRGEKESEEIMGPIVSGQIRPLSWWVH